MWLEVHIDRNRFTHSELDVSQCPRQSSCCFSIPQRGGDVRHCYDFLLCTLSGDTKSLGSKYLVRDSGYPPRNSSPMEPTWNYMSLSAVFIKLKATSLVV